MSVSMSRIIASAAVACFIVVATSVVGLAQSSSDTAVGTWQLNVAKSTYSPGPAPKSVTVTITSAGQGIKVVSDGVGPDGKPINWHYTASYDGKEYPVSGNPLSDKVAVKRVNPNTVELTNTMGGKPRMMSTAVVSSDGKVLTVTQKGTTGDGQPVQNTLVFEK